MPVVTAATAIDLDDGMTVILIMNEVLWLGDSQYTSLLNLNQVQYASHQADDIPLFLSQGSLIHGIKMKDEVHIPFSLKGKSSLLYICTLTAKRWNSASILSSPRMNHGILPMWIGKRMKKNSRESTVMRGMRSRLFTKKTRAQIPLTPWSRPPLTTC